MPIRASFTYDDYVLRRNIRELDPKIQREVKAAVLSQGTQGIAALKQNAPWTDRTGAARSGLHTLVTLGGDQHVILYAHTVHYGIWLEVKFSGRDATIMPTILKEGPDLMRKLDGIIGRLE